MIIPGEDNGKQTLLKYIFLPAKQSMPFARATMTITRIRTIMTIMTIIPTVNELESAAEIKKIYIFESSIFIGILSFRSYVFVREINMEEKVSFQ